MRSDTIVNDPPASTSNVIEQRLDRLEAQVSELAAKLPAAEKWTRSDATAAKFGLTVRHLHRLVEAGTIPPPRYFGATPFWNETALLRALADGRAGSKRVTPSRRKGGAR